MQQHKKIGIIGHEGQGFGIAIISALARSCGLDVCEVDRNGLDGVAGVIVHCTEGYSIKCIGGLPTLHLVSTCSTAGEREIAFGTTESSPVPFRGRKVMSLCALPNQTPNVNGIVIASACGLPLWISRVDEGNRHDIGWIPQQWIDDGECVFDYMNHSRFIGLLPLLDWLRSLSSWSEWTRPAPRACFMFDDPNLHGTRYGFVNYAQLADQGLREYFHTSFASVPLDGYFVNRAAARIFQENRKTLSLLVHGNNHTYRELGERKPASDQLGTIQQALSRTGRLEQKAGITVSKVMAPPHGVCSADMMRAMMYGGMEAVCVSHGSVWTGNPGAKWTASLGSCPVTLVNGLPVIPRFCLDYHVENNMLLAAYLDQPIIPVGHHWDLADGTELLSSAAHSINSLGDVKWGNMEAIARSNYRSRIRGEIMRVQTFSRITELNVPADVTILEIEAPWIDSGMEDVECRKLGSSFKDHSQKSGAIWRFQVCPGERVKCSVLPRSADCSPGARGFRRTPVGAIARKILVEMRDRSMPYVPRNWIRR